MLFAGFAFRFIKRNHQNVKAFYKLLFWQNKNIQLIFSHSDWTTSSLMWGPTWRTWTWSPPRTLAWCSPCPPTRSRATWASPWPGTASPTPRPPWPTSCSWAQVINLDISGFFSSKYFYCIFTKLLLFVVIPSYLEMALKQNEVSKNEKISFLVLDVLDVLSSSIHISPECSLQCQCQCSLHVRVYSAHWVCMGRQSGPERGARLSLLLQ